MYPAIEGAGDEEDKLAGAPPDEKRDDEKRSPRMEGRPRPDDNTAAARLEMQQEAGEDRREASDRSVAAFAGPDPMALLRASSSSDGSTSTDDVADESGTPGGGSPPSAKCLHGYESASRPGTCVCAHGWGGPKCEVDQIPSCDRSKTFTCTNVVTGRVLEHPSCECHQECARVLSEHYGDGDYGAILEERRRDHGGCVKGEGGKLLDPTELPKEVQLSTVVDEAPVYERVDWCVAKCNGRGRCVMHACECDEERAGMWCQFDRDQLPKSTGEKPRVPLKPHELAIEVLELPAAVAHPMVSKFWGGGQNVYGATHEFVEQLVQPPNVEHLVAPSLAPVKLVPFFPSDNFDNIGEPLGWLERLLHRLPESDTGAETWYLFVSNQDRGMCAHPGMRNMLPKKSVVLSSFGLFGIEDMECFYPDRDVVLPAYKNDLGEALPEYFQEDRKRRSDSALLFFHGTLKGVNPRCMGDSLLRSDCNSAYSQGVRMYVVSKYHDTEGFNLGESVDINEDMTKAKFCLVAGGYGFDMRLYDAISRGCVPLLTQQDTWQPLQHVLRYDRFALRVRKEELAHLKEVLEAVPEKQHAAMVANLRQVHKAFAWFPGMNGVDGRSMAMYHVVTAIAIVTGLDLPQFVRDMICTEHGEEFVLTMLTREAQEKVLPCTIDGRSVEMPEEDNFGTTEDEDLAKRVKELTSVRERKQGQKPQRAISRAKHFGFDRKK